MADRAWHDNYDRCYDLCAPAITASSSHGTYQLRVQHGARVAPLPD
jgi:hypothetical protein